MAVFEEKSLASGEHRFGLYYVFVIVSDLVSVATAVRSCSFWSFNNQSGHDV